MRIAVLSDIHGNRPALEAVLEDMAGGDFDAIACLGDHVSGPVDPVGALDLLMGLGAVSIRGNHDRWTVDPTVKGAGCTDRFAHGLLRGEQLEWLAALPATAAIGDEVFLCHGTPQGDEIPWLDDFYIGRTTTLPREADVTRAAADIPVAVLLCGHTHIARTVRLADGRQVVNPGAVGMQLVRGSPDAHYAVIEKRRRGWRASLIAVPYDTDLAARLAVDNGFPQWTASIRSGWAGPESLL